MSNENIDIITLANRVANEKENIRQAIATRGVDIPPTTPLNQYPAKIMAINTENVATDVYLTDKNYDPSTTELLIPGNYGVIADNALSNKANLTSVDLNYVNTVANGAFANCHKLATVTGSHVKYIGSEAFKNTKVSEYTNNNLKYLGNFAFENSSVASVSIPNCGEVMGGAFFQADSLTTVNMNSARVIPAQCFFECNILNSVSADSATAVGPFAFHKAGNGAYDTYSTKFTLSFPEVLTVSTDSFSWINGLTSIDLPKCISIGSAAFYANPNLATVNAPKVRDIAASAFDNANNIYKFYAPECTSVGPSNFAGNGHALTELTVANGCDFGDWACRYGVVKLNGKPSRFEGHNFYQLKTITVDVDFSEVTYIGAKCFNSYDGYQAINLATPVIDLKNCTQIGAGSGYDSIFFGVENGNSVQSSGYSNVEKVWLRGDCNIVFNDSFNMNMLNRSQCHIYTDASSKPANWSQICPSATWHFGATHAEFEAGL